jgi:hypothetical protein
MATTTTPDDRSTDPHDELALPHFEAQLWAEIQARHEDGAWAQRPTGPARAQRAVPRPPSVHRRAVRRSLAAAAALAVIAAVAALSSLGGGGDDGDRRTATGRPPSSTALTPTGDEIVVKTIAAIDEALADSVVHTVSDVADTNDLGDSESWIDEGTGTERWVTKAKDGVLWDTGPATAPAPDAGPQTTALIREVDHCFSEYAETTWTLPPTQSEAERMRDLLAGGSLVADGTGVVDGHELIRLAEATQVDGDQPRDVVYFVDPATYRPVETRIYEGEPEQQIVRFEYAPRTPESLAKLVPEVPQGFTKVAELRSKEEVYGAGCG